MTDAAIRPIFLSWLEIQPLQKCALLFGNVSAGKSTLGYLLKKYIDQVQDQNLTLEEDAKQSKWAYPNQISKKSFSICTIYPKVFNLQKDKHDKLSVIQVPARIYQDPKKKSILDRILNTIGLIHISKQISFAFIIQEKKTSAKIDNWVKVFSTIFHFFKTDFLNENLFSSTMFITSKSDVNKQNIIKRLPDLEKTLQYEEKSEQRKIEYKKMIKTIQEKDNIRVFSKPKRFSEAGNEVQTEIKEIFNMLSRTTHFKVPQNINNQIFDIANPISFSKQQKILFDQFNKGFQKILELLIEMLIQIITQKTQKTINELLTEFQQKQFDILMAQLKKGQENISNSNIRILNERFQRQHNISKNFGQNDFDILVKSNIYLSLKEQFMPNQNQMSKRSNSVKTFLEILSNNGLVKGSSIWKDAYLRFLEYQIFQQRFTNILADVNYQKIIQQHVSRLINQQTENILKTKFLNHNFKMNAKPEYYRNAVNILELLFTQVDYKNIETQKKIKKIHSEFALAQIDVNNPILELPRLWSLRCSQNFKESLQNEKKNNHKFSEILAKMLMKLEFFLISGEIFRNIGFYYSSQKCYEKYIQKVELEQEVYEKYLKILLDLHLYQKALELCFRTLEVFPSNKIGIVEKIRQINSIRIEKNKFDSEIEQKLNKQIYYDLEHYICNENEVKIQEIVDGLEKNKEKEK